MRASIGLGFDSMQLFVRKEKTELALFTFSSFWFLSISEWFIHSFPIFLFAIILSFFFIITYFLSSSSFFIFSSNQHFRFLQVICLIQGLRPKSGALNLVHQLHKKLIQNCPSRSAESKEQIISNYNFFTDIQLNLTTLLEENFSWKV